LLQKSSVQIFIVLESFVYPEIISDHRCVSIQRDFRRRRVITSSRYCLLRCWDFASKLAAQGIILLTVHRIYIVDCTFRPKICFISHIFNRKITYVVDIRELRKFLSEQNRQTKEKLQESQAKVDQTVREKRDLEKQFKKYKEEAENQIARLRLQQNSMRKMESPKKVDKRTEEALRNVHAFFFFDSYSF
jgi:ABC-type multidrug transport system ATPase subunit